MFVVGLLAGIAAHEMIHGVAWRAASGLPASAVSFGIQWKTLTPYAHVGAPMTARSYRIGAAAPGLLMGLLPALVGLAMGWGAVFAFGVFITFGGTGDALVLWLIRDVPSSALVQDHPSRVGCLVQAAR